MDSPQQAQNFYEQFWVDTEYTLAYQYDSAVRDRFPAIRRVWDDLTKPDRVLDYGCGNGVLTSWMQQNGFGRSLVGLDISQTGVAAAQKQFGGQGLEFAVLDPAADLRPMGDFDAVVCSHVLEHVPQPERAVLQFLPLSEWFVIEVPLENCFVQNLKPLEKRLANPLGHVNFWTKASFREFLERYGLIILRGYQYASAPFNPYNPGWKRTAERALLGLLGTSAYGALMATHYAVLARRHPDWEKRVAGNLGTVA